ncbi:MAG: pantoate--beta-alanine ligase [Planctomycetota bacterium]
MPWATRCSIRCPSPCATSRSSCCARGPSSPPGARVSSATWASCRQWARCTPDATLVQRAAACTDHVLATLFVNPLQFGAGEDTGSLPADV